MGIQDRVLIVSGFTASGKSSLVAALAERYGLRPVYSSGVMRNVREGKVAVVQNAEAGRGFWEGEGGRAIFAERMASENPIDFLVDEVLHKELQSGNVVTDSWSMPWLFGGGVKIYLQADFDERVERVAKRGGIDIAQAKEMVLLKDENTRTLFKRLYDFDILRDTHVFHFMLDTTSLEKQKVLKSVVDFLAQRNF